MNFIINYIFLVLLFFGTMIGFGLFNAFLEKLANSYIFHCFGKLGLWLTSFVGTTIHECSHAFFVICTGSKINRIKLFPSINDFESGQPLGYVNYSHSRSFGGMLSLFFIGIGPIIWGPIIILVLMKILIPSTYFVVLDTINSFFIIEESINVFVILSEVIFSFFRGIFSLEVLSSWQFYLFLYLAGSIACHTTLSWADIKGALSGFLYLLLFIIFFGVIMFFFVDFQLKILQVESIIVIFFIVLYIMSLLFSLIMFIVNYFLYSFISKI